MNWKIWKPTPSVKMVTIPSPKPKPPVSEAAPTGGILWGCGHQSKSGAQDPVTETTVCLACHQDQIK